MGQGIRIARIVAAAVTSVAILAAFAALVAVRPLPGLVDTAGSQGAGTARKVAQTRVESVCDGAMTLADEASYGDSEYQATTGDLAYTARFAALGSVYDAAVGALGGTSDDGPDFAGDATDADGALVAGVDDGSTGRVFVSDLLSASDGTGQTGTVASRATEGDLAGLSAAPCVVPALRQHLLVGGTKTGVSQTLVVTNTSAKATAVDVTLRGTSGAGPLDMSVGGTLTVAAGAQATLDLSAAAPNEDGLFVTIASKQTPVAAVVRSVAAQGLTPQGSEAVAPLDGAAATLALPGIRQGDQVRLLVYGAQAGDVTATWLADGDAKDAGKHHVDADRVASVDLGTAPDGALALRLESEAGRPVRAAAVLTRSGDKHQKDFAIAQATLPARSAAVALPDGLEPTLTLANPTDGDATASVTTYGADGAAEGTTDVDVPAGGAVEVDGLKGAVVRVEDPGSRVRWAVRLSGDALDRAKVAGLAVVRPTPLVVREATIWATQSQQVVR